MIINGNLNLKSSSIQSLGKISIVTGNLYLHNCSSLISLGNLKVAKGDLYLWDCLNLKDLGKLKEVGGKFTAVSSGITKKYIEKEKQWLKNKQFWDGGLK
jgi:hypothetical protein